MNVEKQTLEGTWEEISRQADRFAGQRVRLTILNEDQHNGVSPAEDQAQTGTPIYFGMFAGTSEPTQGDFQSAEFHGDPETPRSTDPTPAPPAPPVRRRP